MIVELEGIPSVDRESCPEDVDLLTHCADLLVKPKLGS